MGEYLPGPPQRTQVESDAQPLELKEFLTSLNAARRQSSLYDSDHPSTQQAVGELSVAIKSFLESFGPSTFVFARQAIILNDHSYEASRDTRELFERVRSRGAMAISITGQPTSTEVTEFLTYLNAEPQDIRREGGSNSYLRAHGVAGIILTDTIYETGEEGTESESGSQDEPSMDPAIAALVSWLSKQDDGDDPPVFPVGEILSNPDAAAKLILEAVTRLHASHDSKPPSEVAAEVVNKLKEMAAADHEQWDDATPQIRKAIMKLPEEMRPSSGGFFADMDEDGLLDDRTRTDAGEVEEIVTELLATAGSNADELRNALPGMEPYLGATSCGQLSHWKKEMQPKATMESTRRTLTKLMAWENNSAEHGLIALSLATLIPQAQGMGETQLALEIASSVAEEVRRSGADQAPWRGVNAKAALEAVDLSVLRSLVRDSLKTGTERAQDTAASLVEIHPPLSLAVVEVIENCVNPRFMSSLRSGISKSGRDAGLILGKMLRSGTHSARSVALEILVGLDGDWALKEIAAALVEADAVFLVKALDALSGVRSPIVVRICMDNLRNKSVDVRCAAFRGLGTSGDRSVVPTLIQCAKQGGDRIAAIQALGLLGGDDVTECLEQIAASRSFFRRSQHELVRAAAQRAIQEMQSREVRRGGEKAA